MLSSKWMNTVQYHNHSVMKVLFNWFIGYDTIMLNEFLVFGNRSGVLYSFNADEIYSYEYLNHHFVAMDWIDLLVSKIQTVILYPVSLYLTIFVIVHYLLRQIQKNIFQSLSNIQRLEPYRNHSMQLYRKMLFRAMASYLFENTMYNPMLLGLVSFANTYLDDSHVSLFSLSLVCKEFWQIAVFFFVFYFSIYSFHDKYLCNVVFTHVSLFLLLIFD